VYLCIHEELAKSMKVKKEKVTEMEFLTKRREKIWRTRSFLGSLKKLKLIKDYAVYKFSSAPVAYRISITTEHDEWV
jgi:hypothetical protein